MSSEVVALVVVFPLVALLVAIVCQLGGSGHLKRNNFVGIRLPSTLSSESAWLAGHRAATQSSWFCFIAMALVALLALVIGTDRTISAAAGVIIAVLIVDAFLLLLLCSRAARRAAP